MLLNTHSYYSYKYGTIEPGELIDEVLELGYNSMALTDINATSASLSFVRLAQKKKLHAVLGVDFRRGVDQQFVALARNNHGWQLINESLSVWKQHPDGVPARAPQEWKENVWVIYPFAKAQQFDLLPHERVGVKPHELTRLSLSTWRYRQEQLVAFHTTTFRHKRDFNAHRLLRAIDNNCLLSKLPKYEEGSPHDMLVSKHQLEQWFSEWSILVGHANTLLASCQVNFDFGEEAPHQNKHTYTGSEEEDWELIQNLCRGGLSYRYPTANKAIKERLQRELGIIRDKGFLAYFLITWDLLHYARRKNYFYVGRGSGANSIVAYLLRITDVDPIELDLYFERFINLFRKNPPDFDVDFSWRDRQDITHYLFKKHQHQHTALLGTYVTFQHRAIVRELGKVFGLPKNEIDRLVSGKVLPHQLDHLSKLVLQYGAYIQDFPNHLSIHAGGIIISQKPIHYFTATDMPPKGFPTTHFDMIVAEDIGLYKYDILGQRGLGKIKDTMQIIQLNRPNDESFDIHDIKRFKQDEEVKALLKAGKAIGCFYVESPAMRMLLKKLQVKDYLGLVAASSIIRPGVAQSGMMREYIKRFRDPKEREKAHPKMLEIMPDTFGVMVYQEDVIKVAHYYAGLTLGEADVLRRGMSGKYRSREEFQQVRQTFFTNCKERGHSEGNTTEIWRQIESFAGYAFAKGHSASYAVESYQSLFLKAYYPIEYMVATVNNGGGFYRPELYLHEARMNGADVHAPCMNHSYSDCALYGTDIYLGFVFVHGLPEQLMDAIVRERQTGGVYESLEDAIDRLPISVDEMEVLIRVNAFRFTGMPKRELMWRAYSVMQKNKRIQPMPSLFKTQSASFQFPDLSTTYIEELFDQIELLGFPLSDPWSLVQDQTPYPLRSHDLASYVGKTITIQGYLIAVKNTTTSNKKTMHFGTFIDRDGNWLDTVHFPPVAEQFRFQGKGIYTLTGVVAEEFDVYSLEVERMHKEPYVPDPRYSDDVNKFKQAQRDVYRSSGDSTTHDYTSYGRGKRISKRIEALQK